MLKLIQALRPAMVSAAVAVPMILAGCGGGGGDPAPTTGTPQSVIAPSPMANCNNVIGQLDSAQTLLRSSLGAQLAGVPAAGPVAQDLVESIAKLLDVVDIVARTATSLQQTQDPMVVNGAVADITSLLSCFIGTFSEGIVGLSGQMPGGTAVPGSDQLMAQLRTLNALLGGGLAGGLGAGTVPTNFSLETVTTQLNAIVAQARVVFNQAAAQLPAGTPISPLFPILTMTMGNVSLAIDRLGALDGNGLADTVTFIMSDLVAVLTAGLANNLNLPVGAVTLPAAQLAQAQSAVSTALHIALPTLFTTLRTVITTLLGSVLGGVL